MSSNVQINYSEIENKLSIEWYSVFFSSIWASFVVYFLNYIIFPAGIMFKAYGKGTPTT